MNDTRVLVSVIVLLPILLVGGTLWFSVRTRRGILFGVSVPLDFADSPEAGRLVTNYRARLVLLIATAAASCWPSQLRNLPWLSGVMTPVAVIGSIALWQLARLQAKKHQIAVSPARKAGLSTASNASTAWFGVIVAALAPLGFAALYLRRHWSEFPARFPIHWSAAGVADRWSTRSVVSVGMPLIIATAIIGVMLFLAILMRVAPMPDRQRASSIMLPVISVITWALSGVFCSISLTPLKPWLGGSGMAFIMLGYTVVVGAIVVWMLWRLMKTQGGEAYDGTSDAGWRAGGLIYYNPSDAAVMVPKRIGWGWTFNFARPAAWYCFGAIVVITLGIASMRFLAK